MPMGRGIWYNPQTGQVFDVASDGSYTHDVWIRKPGNADAIGLSPAAQASIAKMKMTDIDEIRKAAVRDGLVRARDYGNSVSVTLSSVGDHSHLLRKIAAVISEQYGRFVGLKLLNIATDRVVEIHLPDLNTDLDNGAPIFDH